MTNRNKASIGDLVRIKDPFMASIVEKIGIIINVSPEVFANSTCRLDALLDNGKVYVLYTDEIETIQKVQHE